MLHYLSPWNRELNMSTYFMHTPYFWFTFCKEDKNFDKSFTFFRDLLPYKMSEPFIRLLYCHFHLKNSPGHNVVIIDGSKLKYTEVRRHPGAWHSYQVLWETVSYFRSYWGWGWQTHRHVTPPSCSSLEKDRWMIICHLHHTLCKCGVIKCSDKILISLISWYFCVVEEILSVYSRSNLCS